MSPPAALATEEHHSTNDGPFKEARVFSQALHGKIIESDGSFFTKMLSKGRGAHEQVMKSYSTYCDKDPMQETEEEKAQRRESYEDLTNSYYNIATDFYEYGWGNSWHFCRFHRGDSFYQAIARHEHYLAMQLNVKPGDKVLDVGCGVGGPAREIHRFTGAHITGITINDYQVARANQYSLRAGLANNTRFVQGNFMNMQFPDNSFDAIYAIEATCHAPKLEDVYKEIYRVLKPGGRCAIYEWCTTDKYDPKNAEHCRIMRGIEDGDGIAELFSTETALREFKNAGFQVEKSIDLAALDDDDYDLCWYYPLEGDTRKVQTLWDVFTMFRLTWIGRQFTRAMVGSLETARLVAPGALQVQYTLEVAADCLVAGGRMGLFTPMFMMVGRKPE